MVITHSLHIDRVNDKIYAFFVCYYRLDHVIYDAIIALSVEDGSILKTATKKDYFDFRNELYSNRIDDPFRIYFPSYRSSKVQWHLNGLNRFVSKSGTHALALTFYSMNIIIIKDPWVYVREENGGGILQRFSGNRGNYGFSRSEIYHLAGSHNIFYSPSSPTSIFQGKRHLLFS